VLHLDVDVEKVALNRMAVDFAVALISLNKLNHESQSVSSSLSGMHRGYCYGKDSQS